MNWRGNNYLPSWLGQRGRERLLITCLGSWDIKGGHGVLASCLHCSALHLPLEPHQALTYLGAPEIPHRQHEGRCTSRSPPGPSPVLPGP